MCYISTNQCHIHTKTLTKKYYRTKYYYPYIYAQKWYNLYSKIKISAIFYPKSKYSDKINKNFNYYNVNKKGSILKSYQRF